MDRDAIFVVMYRSLLVAALLLALSAAQAQNAPASASNTAPMDMSGMSGMAMPSAPTSAAPAPSATLVKNAAIKTAIKKSKKKHVAATAVVAPDSMRGMSTAVMKDMPPAPSALASTAATQSQPTPTTLSDTPGEVHGDISGMNHSDMSSTEHTTEHGLAALPGMTMELIQGDVPPSNARSPDYSDGISNGTMQGMDMSDSAPLGMLLVDQLEAFHGRDANGQSWDIEGWYGNDANKLWVRTEGDSSRGTLEEGDLEAFWNRNVSAFWSTQLGVRHDFGPGPQRDWAAFGIQGLAPYWFDLEATGYVDPSGRTAVRLRAEYELLFTQRLILQPEAEINFYGKDDPAQRMGSGLSDAQFGLRLRYEFNRQFAPYIGVNWVRRFGQTAGYVRQDGQPVFDRQIVAGVRFWF